MVPHAADAATEMFHWQRYLYFRPLYAGKKVVDAACGEGYGSNYASLFATSVQGVDISNEAVRHARKSYPHAQFQQSDVMSHDYSQADFVVSFETIEHLDDPRGFVQKLLECQGMVAISTPNRHLHSPGNRLKDKPFNKFHTVEWAPEEFAGFIKDIAGARTVRFLSQEHRWPGRIFDGLDLEAGYTIAVVGDGDLPIWPHLGFAMPTCNETEKAIETLSTFARYYPGVVEFAIVANGTTPENLARLQEVVAGSPDIFHLIVSNENLGYGVGANRGMEFLIAKGGFDLIGVTNDDVIPGIDCLADMAAAYVVLQKADQNPGLIGPVSNSVAGVQQVDIGAYGDYPGMIRRSTEYSRTHHSSATPFSQIRGLCFLCPPSALECVGGFDPRFGLGNFEDDDFNVRLRLAGYSLWRIDGAFLHHHGSSTFKSLKMDYEANIQRNLVIFIEKWQVRTLQEAFETGFSSQLDLFVPLNATKLKSGHSLHLGGETIDLVYQATDAELASYLLNALKDQPREKRAALLDALRAA